LGEEGGWGNSTPFQRRFFLRIEIGEFIFVMGTNSKRCFLDGMGRKSLVVFQNRLVGFFNFSKIILAVWDGYFFSFFLL